MYITVNTVVTNGFSTALCKVNENFKKNINKSPMLLIMLHLNLAVLKVEELILHNAPLAVVTSAKLSNNRNCYGSNPL